MELNEFIDVNATRKIKEETYNNIGMYSQKFPRDKLITIMDIIQELNRGKTTTIKAVSKLLMMVDEDGNEYVNRTILCFKKLVEELPIVQYNKKELELITRVIEPALLPLFDDVGKNIYFRWTDAQTEEYKEDEVNSSSKRPDGCVTLMANKNKSIAFVEVKSAKYSKDKVKLNYDLNKLGVFSKNAIELNHLNGVLDLQVVGADIAFYFVEKKAGGLILMTELYHLKFPTVLEELPQLLGSVDEICDILHVFETQCKIMQ
ncbi:hypothetical protein G6F46_001944 [Rhizopus delemar]|nr:hypothetical protein G6F55_004288 [Rhizopus delemar]KAG1545286.1 hypothetical protein G6F51_005559 [Rhizopus arrhizus]KAG1498915.1 hypothetical protein G6F54_004748 [Rhizopus delemar]KAG1516278.1 hypothetical protein G6F53_002277 [Rhizopus delemar]KAG1570461.1 hypothetical protein G6F50_005471 [Rhizopus delemar]